MLFVQFRLLDTGEVTITIKQGYGELNAHVGCGWIIRVEIIKLVDLCLQLVLAHGADRGFSELPP